MTAVAIVYGSLYPFAFRIPDGGAGAVEALLRSSANWPGRGDLVANILLYLPLGWFGWLAVPRQAGRGCGLVAVVAAGGLLSLAMELTQYYDAGRVASASDVYCNLAGTLAGAGGAVVLSGRHRLPVLAEISRHPVPATLIVAWAGYRLYPYVPAIDLHKYWNALKPVVLAPAPTLADVYRHTSIWLTVFALLAILVGERRLLPVAPLCCGLVLAARVAIVDTALSANEVVGAALALMLWPFLRALPPRRRAAVLFFALLAAVVVARLEPFLFQAVPRAFGWLPFRSLVGGSVAVAVMAAFEKSFLYGSLLYLFAEANGRLPAALAVVCGTLFATSWAETYLPGRSGEITDAVIALLLGGGLALLRRRGGAPADPGATAPEAADSAAAGG